MGIKKKLCFAFIQTKGAAYGLYVHILSKGRCSFSPLPSPLFHSQVGHSLIRQLASLLSQKMNCLHCDVTSVSFCRGANY